MTSVVADTHAIIWYLVEPERLSSNALLALDRATNTEQSICISAISIVEICYLVERNRLPKLVLQRLLNVCDARDAVAVSIPLSRAIAETIHQIPRDSVPDMPDRIIAATALHLNLPLVTRDRKIQSLEEVQIIW
ncbi:type II toxin-antitoxin system VapC family toxin [Chroococcidiopsis sp. CCNUC1]|uniref:type II toxin-antitoxin system VapC family toxin n=1 Tax=Chroococcidiopsis sp. CCNUC1 TaxID=2653189 RepID=UPI002020D9CF|nr:type II toxin-antitoxin system VapC family toxin [Chroococcidiopsis sp. CCNUC1]URD52689.1 type II toxin-antitoxin system VapC family toxin [Chroococcidiopsis sp. CCNUC1]